MRHYKFFADSNYLLSIINCLKERGCIAYCKFVPDKILSKVNKDMGDYDIYIDEEKDSNLESILSMISSHELIDIPREEYDRLVDKDCKRSYNDLVGKYKVITEERDKYLREQREEILKDVLEEYKDDMERRISEEVDSRYRSLFDRFHKEECRVDEVCSLYKKYIDAEIKKGIEEHIERILNEDNLIRVIPYISKEACHKIMASSKRLLDEFYYRPSISSIYDHDAVYRDINKFKNDLVDNFMLVSGHKRGDRDYMFFMQRAGRLADLIEGKLWEYYILSIKDKEA